ncbi:spermidine/putrescine ABC transporter substrate-binding protein [Candidatus Methylacidiphilum infernorum]|uniref:Spermidine/putrescine-binding periplasmic protein n=1 Tax=Methylacidiphilum infernorum (isolate V4) TaxID=481448 RepID=B3DXY9_METI4|nr:spermidine/putrescine ABC transporter substrate-binding protein [Candidatus Methylacidiphilum infernorum]ACD83941.1 Spermidine/putrescine-binding periplasmic protein [Methylacidiphilum infernorum V4]
MSLHLLVPEGHLPETLLSDYRTRLGEELLAFFYKDENSAVEQIKRQDFDIVAITDRMAFLLIGQGLLARLPVEKKLLPPIDHKFLFHYYDQANTYCWPYGWTLLGISWIPRPHLKNYPLRWSDLAASTYEIVYPLDSLLKAMIIHSLSLRSSVKSSLPLNNPSPALAVYVDTVSELLKKTEKESNRVVVLPKDYSWITLYHWAVPIPKKEMNFDKIKECLFFLCNPQQQAAILSCNWIGAVSMETYMKTAENQRKSSLIYPPAHYLNLCRFFRMDRYPLFSSR